MTTHLAHHFDDRAQQFEAATLGMWIFLATEVLFFGGMFLGYTVYRASYPEAFAEGSRHTDFWLGTVNTAILLTSSLTMALSVHAAQTGEKRAQVRFLAATLLLGLVFLGIKGVEYSHKFHEDLVPGADFALHHPYDASVNPQHATLFFSFYFAMTGCHALHMIIGAGLLIGLIVMSQRDRFSPEYYTPIELTGLYWHFVDIVWVFLYPLLYLIDFQP